MQLFSTIRCLMLAGTKGSPSIRFVWAKQTPFSGLGAFGMGMFCFEIYTISVSFDDHWSGKNWSTMHFVCIDWVGVTPPSGSTGVLWGCFDTLGGVRFWGKECSDMMRLARDSIGGDCILAHPTLRTLWQVWDLDDVVRLCKGEPSKEEIYHFSPQPWIQQTQHLWTHWNEQMPGWKSWSPKMESKSLQQMMFHLATTSQNNASTTKSGWCEWWIMNMKKNCHLLRC